jgi:hypothetical protein
MADHSLENRFRASIQDRGLEWYSALVMVGWGFVLALPGDTLAGPSFVAFQRYGLTESFWAWLFGATGAARLAALYINGRWPTTPYIRMFGSLFGAISWAQVAWLVAEGTFFSNGVASTGTVVYGLLALAEVFSLFRACFDARYYRR